MEENGYLFKGNLFVSFFFNLDRINLSIKTINKIKLFISKKIYIKFL